MRKNNILIGGFLGLVIFLLGCGQLTPKEVVIAPATGQVKINGTLSVDSGVTGGSVKILTAAPSYIVVAQNTQTGTIEFTTTNSSGYFEFTVPANETYSINVIGSDSKYKGPIVIDDLGSNQAAMGLTTASTVELGNILINSSTGKIAPTGEVAAGCISTTEVARTDANGKPVGVGNTGKGSAAQYSGTLASGFDPDKDGLPNFVDADNDGDGVIDELDPGSGITTETVAANDRIDFADIYMSLNVSYDNCQKFDPVKQSSLYFLVRPNASAINDIATIEITSIATEYASATLIETHTCEGVSYPDWTPWSNLGYKLCKSELEIMEGPGQGQIVTEWGAQIRPMVHPQAGDVFVFKVTYNDGSYDKFSRIVNYSFSSVPSLESYRIGEGALQDPPGTNDPSNVITFTGTTEITLNYVRPIDEKGQTLTGFKYMYSIDFYKTFLSYWPQSEYADTIRGTITDADDGSEDNITLHYVLPTEYGGQNVKAYRIDLRCSTPTGAGNGSSGLLMYFKRE